MYHVYDVPHTRRTHRADALCVRRIAYMMYSKLIYIQRIAMSYMAYSHLLCTMYCYVIHRM